MFELFTGGKIAYSEYSKSLNTGMLN